MDLKTDRGPPPSLPQHVLSRRSKKLLNKYFLKPFFFFEGSCLQILSPRVFLDKAQILVSCQQQVLRSKY